jgi:HAD superfamily hydrolase (TIGR01549 family)
MLQAVTFDFWNTLVTDAHGPEREARRARLVGEELEALGAGVPSVVVDEALRSTFDFFDRVWIGEHRTPLCGELVDALFATLGVRAPAEVHDRVVAAFEELVLEMPPGLTPGALDAVPRLAERYRLAVICDTGYSPGRVLRALLQRYGLLHHFRYLFFSDEHGMSKPDERVFRHTLAELGVGPAEAVHVGDIQRTDIAGAQAVGMTAAHYIGANDSDARSSTADLIVRRFAELPAMLGGLTCPGC